MTSIRSWKAFADDGITVVAHTETGDTGCKTALCDLCGASMDVTPTTTVEHLHNWRITHPCRTEVTPPETAVAS